MTKEQIEQAISEALFRSQNKAMISPRLVFTYDRIDVVEKFAIRPGDIEIQPLTRVQIELGLSSTEWDQITENTQKLLKGKI